MSLTSGQIQRLHIAKSKTGMDDDTYRALLGRFNAKSSKDKHLQPAHYDEMMRVFAAMGFVLAPKPATPAGGTRAQAEQINRICAMHQVEPSRLAGIVKRVTGRDSAPSDPLKFCGPKELSKVIQALRRWNWKCDKYPKGEAHAQ
jgi:Protein of unknown function (DUF1018)